MPALREPRAGTDDSREPARDRANQPAIAAIPWVANRPRAPPSLAPDTQEVQLVNDEYELKRTESREQVPWVANRDYGNDEYDVYYDEYDAAHAAFQRAFPRTPP